MDIFIYSDESGVFDSKHNDYYVFGGILFLSKEQKDICSRKYIHAENVVKTALPIAVNEVKASVLSNKHKAKLFRSLNNEYKFGVIIDERTVLPRIFTSKKQKQRYLDYVYKITIRRFLEKLIASNLLPSNEEHHFHFFIDEHATATDGKYELREAMEQEFFFGTVNLNWSKIFPPVFTKQGTIDLTFCNSATNTLVRAADIIANHIYHKAYEMKDYKSSENNIFVIRQP